MPLFGSAHDAEACASNSPAQAFFTADCSVIASLAPSCEPGIADVKELVRGVQLLVDRLKLRPSPSRRGDRDRIRCQQFVIEGQQGVRRNDDAFSANGLQRSQDSRLDLQQFLDDGIDIARGRDNDRQKDPVMTKPPVEMPEFLAKRCLPE